MLVRFDIRVDGVKNYYEYSLNNLDWYPIPSGRIEQVEAVFSGVGFSSDGGYWYVRLPNHSKIGYGKKFIKFLFYFKGMIIVRDDKFAIDFERNFNEYFSLWNINKKEYWSLRLDFNKNLILVGNILPVRKRHIELFLAKQFKSFEFENVDYSQGHLRIYHIDREKVEDFLERIKNVDLVDIPYKRNVFNHEIYGKYEIYYLGETDNERVFLLDLINDNNLVKIVSADHFYDPLYLCYNRYWILKHPIPRNGNID